MPYFDDYLFRKEPELADVSTRIMKLAIYYDYSTRFNDELKKFPCEVSENIYNMIRNITYNEFYKKDDEILLDCKNDDVESNRQTNQISLDDTITCENPSTAVYTPI